MISRDEYLKMPLKDRFMPLDEDQAARAEELQRNSLVIELHSNLLEDELLDQNFVEMVPIIQQSHVDGFLEAIIVFDEDFTASMERLQRHWKKIENHPDFTIALCAQDFLEAQKNGKQSILFQLEPQSFGNRVDRVEMVYQQGIRMVQLTSNVRNYIGDGCGERTNAGLSILGLEMIERMNELGMLIDISHAGIQTSLDAIEVSRQPILCNHTGARALYPQLKRLKTDDVLRAIAEKGGIVGISAIPNHLSGNKEQGIEDVMKHLDYVVNLIGIEHVALGLDMVSGDHVGYHRRDDESGEGHSLSYIGQELNAPYMYGIENQEDWPNVTRGLVSRGYSDDEIRKIIGGNALRIIQEIVG